jgi:hypothetical protein
MCQAVSVCEVSPRIFFPKKQKDGHDASLWFYFPSICSLSLLLLIVILYDERFDLGIDLVPDLAGFINGLVFGVGGFPITILTLGHRNMSRHIPS